LSLANLDCSRLSFVPSPLRCCAKAFTALAQLCEVKCGDYLSESCFNEEYKSAKLAYLDVCDLGPWYYLGTTIQLSFWGHFGAENYILTQNRHVTEKSTNIKTITYTLKRESYTPPTTHAVS